MFKAYYRYENSIFLFVLFSQWEAQAVTGGKLGMIQRAAEFNMNTKHVPDLTVNKHTTKEWEEYEEGTLSIVQYTVRK